MSELYLRNLPVPFFSQRENSYIWKQKYEKEITDDETKVIIYKKGTFVTDVEGKEMSKKIWDYSCNITCLAMFLNYLGVTKDTLLWEKDYISEDDFILEEDIIIDKDEVETEMSLILI